MYETFFLTEWIGEWGLFVWQGIVFYSERLRLFHGSFTDLEKLLTDSCLPTFDLADGVLFDVGTSAMQNNDKQRGFALKHKGPLDMRMNA